MIFPLSRAMMAAVTAKLPLRLFLPVWITLLLTIPHNPANAETAAELGEHLTLTVLTIGPGDPVYLWYGHTAIIVEDSLRKTSTLYDYGIFDFRQDNFYRNFALGRLYYGVDDSPASYRIASALQEQRSISSVRLDLPPENRYRAAEFLRENVLPGNNIYLYHHYYDNCSTRIRDVIDLAVDGQFKTWAQAQEGEMTYREHIRRFSGTNYLMDWLLNYLQSGVIDRPLTRWDDMFLPSELEQALMEFTYTPEGGTPRPLVSSRTIIDQAPGRPPVPDEPAVHWPYALLLSLVLGTAAQLLSRGSSSLFRSLYGLYTGLISILPGLGGIALAFMMFFTDHDVTYGNENLIVTSPLLLAAGVLSFRIMRGNKDRLPLQRRLFLIQGSLAAVLVPAKLLFPALLSQQNWLTLALFAPCFLLIGLPLNRRGSPH
jgi:hypothetical protein